MARVMGRGRAMARSERNWLNPMSSSTMATRARPSGAALPAQPAVPAVAGIWAGMGAAKRCQAGAGRQSGVSARALPPCRHPRHPHRHPHHPGLRPPRRRRTSAGWPAGQVARAAVRAPGSGRPIAHCHVPTVPAAAPRRYRRTGLTGLRYRHHRQMPGPAPGVPHRCPAI